MSQKIVIIGNGISGITCARNIRKHSNADITVISSETEHFYSRTALMYIYMGQMKYHHTKPYEDWFWSKNRINLVQDHVTEVDVQNKQLIVKNTPPLQYDKLVIATGSKSRMPELAGADLSGVQCLYGIQDVQLMFENTRDIKKAVIIGGGLIGVELAEMLLSQNIHVTFLIRENAYWNNVLPNEESALVTRHIKEHLVNLRTGTEVKKITGDNENKVRGVITKNDEKIDCEFVAIAIGVTPNISFLNSSGIETDKGVLVNEYFETSVPDVYAIGDCAQHRNAPPGRKPVEQVWYTGRIHGETLAQTLAVKKTSYNPGPWFNSAKFFDIEYQTYGTINPEVNHDETSFYWEHENGNICFRIAYNKTDETVTGFNALGMRLRHKLCDQFLQEKRKVDDVMLRLSQLNFDPEFFDKHHRSILTAYNKTTGKKILSERKTFLHS